VRVEDKLDPRIDALDDLKVIGAVGAQLAAIQGLIDPDGILDAALRPESKDQVLAPAVRDVALGQHHQIVTPFGRVFSHSLSALWAAFADIRLL